MTTPNLTAASHAGPDSVRDAIGRAARRTGVDFSYLLNQARSESGLNPNAQASASSASGLYQFLDQSWLGVVKQHGAEHGMGWAADAISYHGGRWRVDPGMRDAVFGLRNQAEPAALMAGAFASDNAEGLARALGRQPSQADLYFAHFLGLEGATKFLKTADANPDASAAAAFPREARANRGIFYTKAGEARSLSQVYALMAQKLGGDGGGVQMAGAAAAPTPADHAQLAYAQEVFRDPEDANSTSLALLNRAGRVNILRPSPEYARLAYLMLASAPISE